MHCMCFLLFTMRKLFNHMIIIEKSQKRRLHKKTSKERKEFHKNVFLFYFIFMNDILYLEINKFNKFNRIKFIIEVICIMRYIFL